jgi:hypothetical protein
MLPVRSNAAEAHAGELAKELGIPAQSIDVASP